MNVLIFVMTFLMLLAMLTYGRLSEFTHSQISQVIFENYMQKTERSEGNSAAEILYGEIHKSSKNNPQNQPKVQASPRISLTPLFRPVTADIDKLKQSEQAKIMLKRLMLILYGDQAFFRKMDEERPTFLDDLIVAIIAKVNTLPKNGGLKKASELANLELADPELDQLLYKMLRGAAYEDILKNPQQEVSGESGGKAESDTDQKDQPPVNAPEDYTSPKGYFSLLDFVTLSPYSKVRVYLAPKEVLEVIFPDRETVNEIIQERYLLFKQIKGGGKVDELSRSFESQFIHKRSQEIDPSTLNFTVTKTNPKS